MSTHAICLSSETLNIVVVHCRMIRCSSWLQSTWTTIQSLTLKKIKTIEAARTSYFSTFLLDNAAFIDFHWHQISIAQQSVQKSV